MLILNYDALQLDISLIRFGRNYLGVVLRCDVFK